MDKITKSEAITIRIPAEVKAWLSELAKQNRRSLNTEISLILEKAHEQAKVNRPPFGD